jgi:GT2 family glycosyltransferase
MPQPAVTAVILNWNNAAATRACLRSLAALDYDNLSILVVDNASSDGSADELANDGRVELIRNRTNLGFTGGANAGIRHAMRRRPDFVWLVNSDAVAAPHVLRQLVDAAARDSRAGLLSPVFHDPESARPEWLASRFDPVARIATQTDDPGTATEWREHFPEQIVLLGTALLISRSVIETIGELDDQFFAYVEDVDYSLRATAAGFRNVIVPDVEVSHAFKRPVEDPGTVPPYLHYYITRNYLLLWRKLPGRVLLNKAALWLLRQRLLQLSRMRNNPAATEALLSGLWDGVRGVGGQYDPARRMPAVPRLLLSRRPDLWLNLIDGGRPRMGAAR